MYKFNLGSIELRRIDPHSTCNAQVDPSRLFGQNEIEPNVCMTYPAAFVKITDVVQ